MKIGIEIFDQTVESELAVLRILRSENRWFTTEEISELSKLNTTQTLKILKRLISDMEAFGTDYMEVFFSKGKGARFVTKRADANPRKFLIFLVEETIGFNLFTAIYNEDYTSASNFAMEHFVSDATVRRQLNKFRTSIQPLGLDLSRSDAILTGEETQIRLFLNMALWKIYAGEGWPFEGVSEQRMEYIAENILTHSDLNVTPIQKRQLVFLLAIGIIRRRNNHFIECKESWHELIQNNESFTHFKTLISPFASFSESHPGEIAFLFFLLIIQSENIQIIKFLEKNFEENKKNNTVVYRATEKLEEKLQKYIAPVPEELHKVFLLNAFSYHLFAHIFHNFSTDLNGYDYSIIIDSPFGNPILTHLKSNIQELIKELRTETNFSLFQEENYLISKYGLLFSLLNAQTSFEPLIKIKISTDLPFLVNLRLKERISTVFKDSYNIEFLDASESNHGDILLTNITLPRDGPEYKQVRIAFINRILTFRNIIMLNQNLYELSQEKKEDK
ncbi:MULTISPECIES: helix-turn-helix domain-containing protein [Listeria]|uniref:helix-turn-helix domain-containing protein n=1 Tax=Listeria TaxID=1637 RepID=UPI000B588D51|nr:MULTISPECIES: helix-turn-helix domain-containing protein [Listeria]